MVGDESWEDAEVGEEGESETDIGAETLATGLEFANDPQSPADDSAPIPVPNFTRTLRPRNKKINYKF